MPRPAPYAPFLIKTSQWVQKNFSGEFEMPTLLHADPASPHVIMGCKDVNDLFVIEHKTAKILRRLKVPRGSGKAFNYGAFQFDDGNANLAAYNFFDKSFAVWSINDGDLIHSSRGEGQIFPSICFMPGGRVATCDGPRLNVYALGGDLMFYTPVSDDLRSITMFAPPTPKPIIIAACVFRRGIGGNTLYVVRIENGVVSNRTEGPYRPRPENMVDQKTITLREMMNIPGATARAFLLVEEEKLEVRIGNDDWETIDEYKTRVLAIDPNSGRYYQDELELPGRHCLERQGLELHVIDEQGRRRRVTGFPLRFEHIDWRLD